MAVFDYRQAEEIRDVFARHQCRYLFIGKSGAILLGFPDTTQDADLFVDKSQVNGQRLVSALKELGFTLSDELTAEILRGKDFVQLKNGPFDLDLVFALDGIERFDDAWSRRVEVHGFSVCHRDDFTPAEYDDFGFIDDWQSVIVAEHEFVIAAGVDNDIADFFAVDAQRQGEANGG